MPMLRELRWGAVCPDLEGDADFMPAGLGDAINSDACVTVSDV